MSEIWDLLVIGYWVVTGATLIMVIIKLLLPQIFSILIDFIILISVYSTN